jgi:hypothetical protein
MKPSSAPRCALAPDSNTSTVQSRSEASLFSGAFTSVEMGHIVIDAQRSLLHRLDAFFGVVLYAVDGTTDRIRFHRVGVIRP